MALLPLLILGFCPHINELRRRVFQDILQFSLIPKDPRYPMNITGSLDLPESECYIGSQKTGVVSKCDQSPAMNLSKPLMRGEMQYEQ
jgi:hypothetical protein